MLIVSNFVKATNIFFQGVAGIPGMKGFQGDLGEKVFFLFFILLVENALKFLTRNIKR